MSEKYKIGEIDKAHFVTSKGTIEHFVYVVTNDNKERLASQTRASLRASLLPV